MIGSLLRVLGPEYARPVRRAVALMTVTAIAEGLSYALLIPVLRALLGPDPGSARPWLAAFGGAVAAYALLRYVADRFGFRVGTTMMRGLYRRLGGHLGRLPLGWYTAGRVGELSVLASRGVLQAMSAIAHLLSPLVSATVTPLTIAAVMTAFDWRMGLAALAAAPVVAGVQVWSGRAMTATDADRAERDHEATGRVIEYVQAQPVLRAGGRAGERFELLDASLRELSRATRRATRSALPGALGLTFTVQAVFTGLLALGAYLAVGGSLGGPELLALLVLAARCAEPVLALGEAAGKMRGAKSVLARLEAVLDTEPLPEPPAPVRPDRHDLELEEVTFTRGDRRVLDGLSLTVAEGERVAVVGPSGAGKSSLLQLVPRFYDIDAGAVRVGGVDVRAVDSAELMSRVAIVFQDVYLFDATIEENVRLGRPEATGAEVRAAAAAARLDEVVGRLPGGWAARVGEGGALLSGGERQRVSIARALLKDAPIVLLDEVTSALDPVNEAAVHEGVERLMAGRTVVMVAHRMATVRRADRVVFLDGGRIVEQGGHAELLARGGRYAAFWAASLAPVGE
ncbi:ABC transporter ATP-binding protein [Actinorhabdospora filicis]|uniref:ABC transporter ATP-binding protein n=1 Tax=Actinorhabdospora filicis TaxID=1785913 RepID=A0A9W6W9C7_9ACTN|nr:ABC transporter ATP-binding protein [Actinorhabdospora filicis]GLZ77858.1 ABC transporter ATP-binding protein [Actinorhabdospora filicis]